MMIFNQIGMLLYPFYNINNIPNMNNFEGDPISLIEIYEKLKDAFEPHEIEKIRKKY